MNFLLAFSILVVLLPCALSARADKKDVTKIPLSDVVEKANDVDAPLDADEESDQAEVEAAAAQADETDETTDGDAETDEPHTLDSGTDSETGERGTTGYMQGASRADDDDLDLALDESDVAAGQDEEAADGQTEDADTEDATAQSTDDAADETTGLEETDEQRERPQEIKVPPFWVPKYLPTFRNEMLQYHNIARRKHGAGPLRRSKKLDAEAQEWAKKLATTGKLEFSQQNGDYGENIKAVFYHAGIIDDWYKQVRKYNFDSPQPSLDTAAFTQIVWKNTREIGIGVVGSSKDRKNYVVVRYSPAGNIEGEYEQNVLTQTE